MQWTSDVTAGDWLRERLDDHLAASMHSVVPRGFAAYARIFHPADRDRPVGRPWPPLPYGAHHREWDAFQGANPEIAHERVSWADAAAGFGTTMHELAQWHHLVDKHRQVQGEDGPRDAAGWRYGEPCVGGLPADLVAVIAAHLAAHTSTPDAGYAALWEGWGGLVGFFGETPSRTFLTFSDDPDADRHNAMLGRSIPDRFNNVFRKPVWQPGILPDDVSRGPRLALPAREHILFRGGVAEFADPDWVLHVPWRDREGEEHGFPPSAQSPSIVWPDDRVWVLVTEVDFDSTIAAGSPELVRALCTDPRLEARVIRADADLTWDGDPINR
ncbi:MAG: hypothetical protein ACK5IN_06590 [Microbacterium sp.]|uniref:hypothetical protein n=1 Tax=Microbacterium sp. TaxID=51671 RepID=UPI003A8AB068